ncbi:LysR substrate-binding domain-containing protein [Uliginosibacterium sp. H1]|uniref:LysR substrate-binding domain-containing protein n=1 Tax=Uliginosibacterium sp. H1 TaxID=3114757 RepID=UPI002E19F42A|nr:LysR substrate-binding domain-containing protein [Uliginosibacterium sp. H1]
MNLHLLRVFVTVVEQQGFSRAAEVLDISQPAVSKAVRELESQLDTVLLERGGKQLRPSDPGRVLYDYGRAIFALEREAAEAVRAYYALERGRLTIGASTTIGTYWLPPLVATFHREHPQVQITLRTGNTQHVAQWLLDCEVDVALVEGPVDDDRLESRTWRSEEMVVVAPKQSAWSRAKQVEPAQLKNQVWVMREPGSGSREVAERVLAELGIDHGQTVEVGSNEAIVQTVAAGAGLGLVPRVCAEGQLAMGLVMCLPLVGEAITRPLFRLRLPRRPVSQVALAFEAMLGAV